jgi:hypothetical protein
MSSAISMCDVVKQYRRGKETVEVLRGPQAIERSMAA